MGQGLNQSGVFRGDIGELVGVLLAVIEADDFAGGRVVGQVTVIALSLTGGVDQFPAIPEKASLFVFEIYAEYFISCRSREEVATVGYGQPVFQVEQPGDGSSHVYRFRVVTDGFVRRDFAWEAEDERDMHGGLVKAVFFKAAMVAKGVTVVGHVDDEGVFRKVELVEMSEHAAHGAVEVVGAGVVGGDDALLLLGVEGAENVRDLPGVLRAYFGDLDPARIVELLVFGGEVEGGVGFLNAEPHGEGGVFMIGVEPALGLSELPGGAHFLVVIGKGLFRRVEPLAGGIPEGTPGWAGPGDGLLPAPIDSIFGHGVGEAVHAVFAGRVEVHLAEGGGLIAVILEQLGEGWLRFAQGSFEGCDADCVWVQACEDGLARGRADGGIANIVGEASALRGEALQVGRVAAHDVAGMIVCDEEEEVRF